jgi:hypothetical protein
MLFDTSHLPQQNTTTLALTGVPIRNQMAGTIGNDHLLLLQTRIYRSTLDNPVS